ncbi:hypothetical protein AALA82_09265 [Oscillospiraceae bacterium 50-16]
MKSRKFPALSCIFPFFFPLPPGTPRNVQKNREEPPKGRFFSNQDFSIGNQN